MVSCWFIKVVVLRRASSVCLSIDLQGGTINVQKVPNISQGSVATRLRCSGIFKEKFIIVCPIVLAYSMGQIINSVCLCHSVCPSVCVHSHDRISWSIFAKSGIQVTTPKVRTSSLGQHCTTHFGRKDPENPCKHKLPISALNVRESREFLRCTGNWSRVTR